MGTLSRTHSTRVWCVCVCVYATIGCRSSKKGAIVPANGIGSKPDGFEKYKEREKKSDDRSARSGK